MIFRAVSDGRPYPDHELTLREWAQIPPRAVRLDELITTKRELALDRLLAEDSTFYGDLFPHVVVWRADLYLEDGVHRALRAALQQRHIIHARVYAIPSAVSERGSRLAGSRLAGSDRGGLRIADEGGGHQPAGGAEQPGDHYSDPEAVGEDGRVEI